MLFVQPNVRVGVGWIETPAAAAAGLDELAGGLEPFPAPTVVRVDLEPGNVADPAPYLALRRFAAGGQIPVRQDTARLARPRDRRAEPVDPARRPRAALVLHPRSR